MSSRHAVLDTLFMVFYVGLAAAVSCLTVVLALNALLGNEAGDGQALSILANVTGWIAVIRAPALYRRLMAQAEAHPSDAAFGNRL